MLERRRGRMGVMSFFWVRWEEDWKWIKGYNDKGVEVYETKKSCKKHFKNLNLQCSIFFAFEIKISFIRKINLSKISYINFSHPAWKPPLVFFPQLYLQHFSASRFIQKQNSTLEVLNSTNKNCTKKLLVLIFHSIQDLIKFCLKFFTIGFMDFWRISFSKVFVSWHFTIKKQRKTAKKLH